MYVKNEAYAPEPNILASEKCVNFTITVSDEGVTADANGRKYVPVGTLLATDGKKFTADVGQTLAGILFRTADVTHGPQPGACMVEGYVIEGALPQAEAGVLAENLKTALADTKITLR